ncbi:MAG: hypothetical protein K6U03_02050 [Firmicutes bacterium]|nr:hypothetical protein [Bacillota bacterium]
MAVPSRTARSTTALAGRRRRAGSGSFIPIGIHVVPPSTEKLQATEVPSGIQTAPEREIFQTAPEREILLMSKFTLSGVVCNVLDV